MCFEGEQNLEGHEPQSEQYLHNWGRAITLTVPCKVKYLVWKAAKNSLPTNLRKLLEMPKVCKSFFFF